LNNKNWCVVLKNTKDNLGMINKVKDYVTWGEISKEFFEDLVKKKGEEYTTRTEDKNKKIEYKKYFEYKNKKYNRFFRLHPPLKGYGRKGVKTHFNKGGALGYRAEKIKNLIERMI
jgi:large subunit ribosomal protein L30